MWKERTAVPHSVEIRDRFVKEENEHFSCRINGLSDSDFVKIKIETNFQQACSKFQQHRKL